MPSFAVAQALFRREHEQAPKLVARSADFDDDWLREAERLMAGFGERRPGFACPLAVFAQPISGRLVAIVQAADLEPGSTGWAAMAFRIFVAPVRVYESFIADPFRLAAQHPFDRSLMNESTLPTIEMFAEGPPPRTVAEVQAVLKRVKAHALKEGEDPETVERTVENSESPALLGGVQILVDGGKLILDRKAPDNSFAAALWSLLPDPLRSQIWPASFAFSNALRFDVLIGTGFSSEELPDYRSEDQAADYPPGAYEMALQHAAEQTDQSELNSVFQRRSSGETLRLARNLLIGMVCVLFAFRFLAPPTQMPQAERERRARTVASIVGVGHPWQIYSMILEGNRRFRDR